MFNLLSATLYKALWPIAGLTFAVLFVLPGTIRAGEQVAANPLPPPVKKKESNFLSFWDGKLVLDIEERIRFEERTNNRDFAAGANNHEITDGASLRNRFRIGLAITPSP